MRSAVVGGCVVGALALAGPAAAAREVEFTRGWGGSGHLGAGYVAGYHHENLCKNELIEPGESVGARVAFAFEPHPSVAPSFHDTVSVYGTLICAHRLEIWPHTAGPWDVNAPGGPGSLSISCPHDQSPVDNGVGCWASTRHLTQAAGGHGSADDGYWHYKFHNWTGATAEIQLWAVCVPTRDVRGRR